MKRIDAMLGVKDVVWVFLACGSGGVARLGIQLLCSSWFPVAWQGWGTVLSNALACFLAGLFSGFLAGSGTLRLALLTGFCGGLSTFSAFALDYLPLVREGHWSAWVLVFAQVIMGLVMAWIGLVLADAIRV
ncbi:MAG: CrcB family protein [Bacteroidetes bacterium]|nr:CrcB family protein [Bacteroidota bacterium]